MGLANLLLPALVAWALCGATIAIGRAVTSLRNALIAHAVAAPVIFGFASLVYFRAVHYTTPFQTAIIYVSLVMVPCICPTVRNTHLIWDVRCPHM